MRNKQVAHPLPMCHATPGIPVNQPFSYTSYGSYGSHGSGSKGQVDCNHLALGFGHSFSTGVPVGFRKIAMARGVRLRADGAGGAALSHWKSADVSSVKSTWMSKERNPRVQVLQLLHLKISNTMLIWRFLSIS